MTNFWFGTEKQGRYSSIRELPENIPAETLRLSADAVIDLINDYRDVLSPMLADVIKTT